MNTKTLYMQEIGEIKMIKSQRAKNINISIRPFKGVKVSVPNHVNFEDAEAVVWRKASWIKKHIKRMSDLENNITVFDEKSEFKTRDHTLKIQAEERNNTSIVVRNKVINIKYPANKNIKDNIIQTHIRAGIERALRKEASEYLPKRVSELAEKYGFKYKRVYLKNLKTRWGSCSSRGNINLNIHLMRLSDRLVDLVILHELAHTIELNHSKKFWAVLDKIVGNAKIKDKELKKYKTQIF